MKKVVILSLLFLFGLSFLASAQDIIYKKDGSKEEVKIIVVGKKEIQYKKFSNQDGPVYELDRNDILLITYENGEFETISKQEDVGKPVKPDLTTDFTKNILSLHLFDIVFGDIGISYERIFSSGTVGFKIPVALGYDYQSDKDKFYNIIYSGLGVNFYPTGQGKFRYVVGPQVRFGYGKENHYSGDYYYDDDGYYHEIMDTNEGFYTQFFVDNGFIFTPIRNFSFSVIGSVGMKYFPEASDSHQLFRPDGQFAVNIGYRF
jgi:hypothetical protein